MKFSYTQVECQIQVKKIAKPEPRYKINQHQLHYEQFPFPVLY
jgi:hypothetical protein